MGSRNNRVCILDAMEFASYQKTGAHPSCLNHEHVSMNDARELTGDLLYTENVAVGISNSFVKYTYEYDWVRPVAGDKIKAIHQQSPLHWVIRRSGGMGVHQLVHY